MSDTEPRAIRSIDHRDMIAYNPLPPIVLTGEAVDLYPRAMVDSRDDRAYVLVDTVPDEPLGPAVPDPTFASPCGWITEDGIFYPCPPWGHIPRARQLGLSYQAAETRWIRITRDTWDQDRHIVNRQVRCITQRQIDALWSWCRHHDLPFLETCSESHHGQ